MKILTTAPTGSPEWVAARKGKIGGNMAADILGVGRNTPAHAFAVLTEKIVEEDISKLAVVRRGNLLEPVILRGFELDSGYTLIQTPGLIEHEKYPFLAGTPDALYRRTGKDNLLGVVDAKSVGFYKVHEWQAQVPLRVQVQTAFYALLLGPMVDFHAAAAMPNDEDDDAEPILWDEQGLSPSTLARMEEQLVRFWEYNVQRDISPECDPVADRKLIKSFFPRDVGTTFKGTEELLAKWRRVEEINAQIGEGGALFKEKERLRAEIEAQFGADTWAEFSDFRLQYKLESRKAYPVPAWEGRVLRKVKA